MIKLLFLTLFTMTAFAQDKAVTPFDNIAIISEGVPYEFEMLIDHLKNQDVDIQDQKTAYTRLSLINEDLSNLSKRDLMFLLKSEVYKAVLTSQYLDSDNKMQMNSSLIKGIPTKLTKHSVIYSKFSSWVITSVHNDLAPYLQDNFIDRYQNISRGDTDGMLKAKKLERIIKFTNPIIEKIFSLSPEDFNKLATKMIIDCLDRLSKKTFFFKTYSGKLESNSANKLFNIPPFNFTLPKIENLEAPTLQDEREEKKKEAQTIIKSLEDEDMSGASEVIDSIAP